MSYYVNVCAGLSHYADHDHEGYNVTLSNNIFVKLGATEAPHSDGTLRSASPTNKPVGPLRTVLT